MSTSQGSVVDRLDHEIRCLEAIDAGLQSLPLGDFLGSEADFAHLVQDRIDRLREIMEELEGGEQGADNAPADSPARQKARKPLSMSSISSMLSIGRSESRRASRWPSRECSSLQIAMLGSAAC
jgi:hypothetical protein